MGEIGKMFLRWRFNVCALSETMLKGKGEVMGTGLAMLENKQLSV